MSVLEILLIIGVFAFAVFVITFSIINHKKGKGCCGDCANCNYCYKKETKEK